MDSIMDSSSLLMEQDMESIVLNGINKEMEFIRHLLI